MLRAMSTTRRLLRWAPLVACAAVLVWHSLQYDFVTDDAYISFVFSRNFAEHGELTFNLGEPVEGYTNFLWTFVLGVLMKLGIAPELSSRVLGTACAIATLAVAYRLTDRLLRRDPAPRAGAWAYLPPLLLALSSGYACWSSGGLETQLFTLLVTLAIDAYAASATPGDGYRLRAMGVFLALAAMTRPEGLLVAAVLGGHRLVTNIALQRRLLPDRHELSALGAFLLLWAPWFAWRWWYYGWPFPNTYYVKAAGALADPRLGAQIWDNGWYYLKRWLEQTGLLYAFPLVLAGLVGARPRSERFAYGTAAALLAAVYLVYTASVGGDFMGLHRFIMPVFVIAAVGLALGLELVTRRLPPRVRQIAAPVLAAIIIAAFAFSQIRLTHESLRWGNFANDRGIDTPAFLIVYTEDRATIGRAMKDCFRPDDFSIVGGAGAQPYEGRMRGIDVFGLVSSRIAHEEPRIRARAGHTKWGSDRLLAEHDPEFVFSCYDIHRDPTKHGARGCAGFWLGRGYELVTMHIPGLRERGEYYTFLAKKERAFQCPGRVPP
jgi:arabinofuranosyltransferase